MIETVPTLAVSPEKICLVAIKAREFDAKDMVTIPDGSSNATDDGMISVLDELERGHL